MEKVIWSHLVENLLCRLKNGKNHPRYLYGKQPSSLIHRMYFKVDVATARQGARVSGVLVERKVPNARVDVIVVQIIQSN